MGELPEIVSNSIGWEDYGPVASYLKGSAGNLSRAETIAGSGALMNAWNAGRLLPSGDGWRQNAYCLLCGFQGLLPCLPLGELNVKGSKIPWSLARCGQCHLAQLDIVTEVGEASTLEEQDAPGAWLRERAGSGAGRVGLDVVVWYLPRAIKHLDTSLFDPSRILYFSLHSLEACLATADLLVYDARLDDDGKSLTVRSVPEAREPTPELLALRNLEKLLTLDSEELWAWLRKSLGRPLKGETF